jgi:hypothetical protein
MANVSTLQEIKNIKVGDSMDWKPCFTTYDIYRKDENTFEINCTNGTWQTAIVTIAEIEQIFEGTLKLINLNWN